MAARPVATEAQRDAATSLATFCYRGFRALVGRRHQSHGDIVRYFERNAGKKRVRAALAKFWETQFPGGDAPDHIAIAKLQACGAVQPRYADITDALRIAIDNAEAK
jgi:hypothetical protein